MHPTLTLQSCPDECCWWVIFSWQGRRITATYRSKSEALVTIGAFATAAEEFTEESDG